MSGRTISWLVWPLSGLLVAVVVVVAGAGLVSQRTSAGATELFGEALISVVVPVVFATVAALILSRQPRNTIGWLLMVPVGLYVVGTPVENYVDRLAPTSPDPTVPLLLAVWFSNWGWLLLIFSLLHLPLLFPGGRHLTPRWRWVSVAAVVWAALFILMATLSRRLAAPGLTLENPVGIVAEGTVQRLAAVWVAGLLALVVACVAALFVRYRRASDVERRQIKWLLYACAVFVAIYVGGTVVEPDHGDSNTLGSHIWTILFALSLMALPVAIGIAILRYRLYDIDVIINRTLVYGALTVTLVATYFGGIVVLQRTFALLAVGESTLAVVASTLLIAALFNPVRRRIQSFIDRRFYRRKYDARRTLEAFTTRLRDETDLGALGDDLVGVVRGAVQPEHVSLWLRSGSAREDKGT